MNQEAGRAIAAATRAELYGFPVSLADRSFWDRFGSPSVADRQEILARSAIAAQSSRDFMAGASFGTLGSLLEQAGLFTADQGDTPTGSGTIRVAGSFRFDLQGTGEGYKGWSQTFRVTDSLQDILDQIQSDYSAMATKYGLSEVEYADVVDVFAVGSFIIY
jgi:hypothetical protein